MRHVLPLRCETENHEELVIIAPKKRTGPVGAHADLVIILDDRVVIVGVPVSDLTIPHRNIVLQRVLPPVVEYKVKITSEVDVVEPQTKARRRQSYGPHFCILAMAAFGSR